MDTCDIICIMDRSGSMHSVKSDAIGGFNSLVEEQKKLPGECALTLVLFNEHVSKVIDRRPIAEAVLLNDDTYQPSGMTALLDAVGNTLTTAMALPPPGPDHKVIVAVITDGFENSSREFSAKKVKELTEELTAKGWTFIYVGANQDAFAEAGKLGMQNQHTHTYAANPVGTRSAYGVVGQSMTSLRTGSSTTNQTNTTDASAKH